MSDADKLKAIEEMGINWELRCPYSFKLKEVYECPGISLCDNYAIKKHCSACWIATLEG